MKRRDWLFLALAVLLIAGAAVGIYQYRLANNPDVNQPSAAGPSLQAESVSMQPHATLWVTQGAGMTAIVEKTIPVEDNDTVMDVLKRSGLEIKTSYGNSFVEAIGGLASEYRPGDRTSKKLDWFYYVNGMMADVGAAEYPVQPGDSIWWDYHSWDFAISTPALIGAYPHPFQSRGDEPSVPLIIMFTHGYEKQAEQVVDYLRVVRQDIGKPQAWDEQLFTKESAFLLVGDAKTLAASTFLRELWQNKQSSGLFADLGSEGIKPYNQLGEPVGTYQHNGTGVLLSTVHPITRFPLWVISGVDPSGVEKAASALQISADKKGAMMLRAHFGLLLSEEKRIPLPLESKDGGSK